MKRVWPCGKGCVFAPDGGRDLIQLARGGFCVFITGVMIWKPLLPAACALLSVFVIACQEEEKPKVRSGPDLVQKEDKLFYEAGASEPFTGTQRGYAGGTRALIHECEFLNGQKHGWERRWYKDKPEQMAKQIVWVQGERAFFFEWWPNGNLKQLASQRTGADHGREDIAHGAYVKWFEDGKIKFRANYNQAFRWHGDVLDYNDEGKLMWDAVFNNGKFVSGHHPEDYKPAAPKEKKEDAKP